MELFRQPGAGTTLVPAAASGIAAGVGGIVWAAALPDIWLLFAAVGAASVGVVEAGGALVVLWGRRRAADDWLRSATGDFVPARYVWRARQLRAACERLLLAKTLRLLVRRAAEDPRGGFGALRLTAVSENREALQLLASTLERVDQPVTPAGMLRVIDLITDGGGPLWNTAKGSALAETISSILAVLRLRPDDPQEHVRSA
jgi:hypothetical protein